MNKLLRNLLFWAGLTALGVVSANCGPERIPECNNKDNVPTRLELRVNDNYTLSLPENTTITDVSDNKFVSFDKNELMINPWHVYNGNINMETIKDLGLDYCTSEYDINLKIDPLVDENNTRYSYYRPINESSFLVCDETDSTKCPYEINNFIYLDTKYLGIKKSIEGIEKITGRKPIPKWAPIKIHLNASPNDSLETYLYTKDEWSQKRLGGLFYKNHIFVCEYDWATFPNWPIFCLNLENPTQMPTEPTETCQCVGDNASQRPCNSVLYWTEDYYKNPAEINSQIWVIHEYAHSLITLPKFSKTSGGVTTTYDLNEELSNSLEILVGKVTNGRGTYPYFINMEKSSLCDLPWSDTYEVVRGMCNLTDHKFDIETLPAFYEYMVKAYEKRSANDHCYDNGICVFNGTRIEDVKCALDYATKMNTYRQFCLFSDCNQIIFPNGNKDYYYVPLEFCGSLEYLENN